MARQASAGLRRKLPGRMASRSTRLVPNGASCPRQHPRANLEPNVRPTHRCSRSGLRRRRNLEGITIVTVTGLRRLFQIREFTKVLAAHIPTRWIEPIANYSVMRENASLLPAEYIIADRQAYFARVHETVGGTTARLLFLEFGVLDGDSIRHWAGLNANPGSRFVGFDSFEGIPAAWRGREPGYFDRAGQIPAIADDRVRFVKGWFNQTLLRELDTLRVESRDSVVVVHIDADLYSSALYCLTTLAQSFSNFYVLFDEYGAGEARALRDFLDAYGVKFDALLGLKRTRHAALPTRVFGRIGDRLP
jgi:O-methyltransferase